MEPRAVGDVVVDGHREWIRALEDHSHPLPQSGDVDVPAVDVPAVEHHLSVDPGAIDEIVHAVEAAEER